MLFADICYIDENATVIEHGWVGTIGAHIAYLGTEPPPDSARFGPVYAGKEKLLIPGFFNAHSHAAMSLLRGYGENMTLDNWLHKRIFPFEEHLQPEDIYWGTLLSCAEMLRYGIVSTTDMYMKGMALGRAFDESGVKANFSVSCTDFAGREYGDMPQSAETKEVFAAYHDLDDGRLQVDFSMHAEYTSTEKMVRSLADFTREHGKRMHVHVSETAVEVAACRDRHNGRSPVQYLADCGIFDLPTTAAHCVHITEEDIAILAAKQVSVAHCPKSNLKLASGIAPARKLLAAGVNLALGTDSVASNNNLDFLEEIRFFSLLQKGASQDPTLITPAQALHAATRAGALAQGRADCGLLHEGFRADLVVLDLAQPHLLPAHDLLHNLIYSAGSHDVTLTMVDGRVCYENGSWPQLDMEQIFAQTERIRRRILAALEA